MEGFLYLLESEKNGSHYLGSTVNTETRIAEHNSGITASTKNKGPWKLFASWKFDTIEEARSVEYYIKRMKIKLTKESVDYWMNKYKNKDS